MGWLRELMRHRVPPIRSFEALARQALASPDWPTDTRVKPRSLAALLGKLDREQGLEWLWDREAAQRALAQVLRRPLADIRVSCGADLAAHRGRSRQLRIEDVPLARALDLVDEPLCPGIPAAVLEPATWDCLWWVAPTGSGKTMTGSWLDARSLATFVREDNGANLDFGRLPRGAVFLELSRGPAPEGLPGLGQRICVAAPFAPGPGWTVVTTGPIDDCADALVDWLAARLPRDGHFDPARVLDWLRSQILREGWIDSLGTLLGVCGAIDEIGISKLDRLSAHELGRRFFLHRASQLDQSGQGDGVWLRRHGLETLLGMIRRSLTDADQGWQAPRPVEGWMELVPLEHQREADLDWLRLSLGNDKSGIRSADLERAARHLPPGAYRIVRGLREAGLLVPAFEAGRSCLRPRWFARLLEREACAGLGQAPPSEWGEALLRAHSAATIMDQIWRRAQREDSGLIEDVVELEADHEPAHVAAVEAVFSAVGLAILQGAEFPPDLLESLFVEQLRLLVELPGELPRPRTMAWDVPASSLLAHGSWLLAALAMGEELPRHAAGRHPLLRPWLASAPADLLVRLLDRVLDSLKGRSSPPPWSSGALALVDRLRAVVGRAGADWHPLERPGVVFEEYAHDVLCWDTVVGLEGHGVLLEAMIEYGGTKGYEWSQVAEVIWRAWQQSGGELGAASLLSKEAPWASRLWPYAPTGVLAGILEQCPEEVAFAQLSEDQWVGLIEAPPHRFSSSAIRLWWQAIPERLFDGARSACPPDHGALAVLWQRAPAYMLGMSEQAWRSRNWSAALSLMQTAPSSRLAELIAIGEAEPPGSLPDDSMIELRRLLAESVGRRAPEWRRAYAWLARLEQDWARTSRAT